MTDEEMRVAAQHRDPTFLACAWIGALDREELHDVARQLTADDLWLDAGGADELRALLPADVADLWLGDRTDLIALDCEQVFVKTSDGSLLTITMRHDAGEWQVHGASVQSA